MELITLTRGHRVETGCYVDGHWGQYAYDRIAEIADTYAGTDLAIVIARAREDDRDDMVDVLVDTGDKALDALNEITPDGYRWDWHDGEIFLMPTFDDDADFDDDNVENVQA